MIIIPDHQVSPVAVIVRNVADQGRGIFGMGLLQSCPAGFQGFSLGEYGMGDFSGFIVEGNKRDAQTFKIGAV